MKWMYKECPDYVITEAGLQTEDVRKVGVTPQVEKFNCNISLEFPNRSNTQDDLVVPSTYAFPPDTPFSTENSVSNVVQLLTVRSARIKAFYVLIEAWKSVCRPNYCLCHD